MSPKRLKSYLMLVLVAAIWGSAGPIIKFTLDGIDPVSFLAYRFAISAVLATFFFAFKLRGGKQFRKLRKNLPLAVLYGLLATPIGLGILFTGLNKTTVLDLTLIGVIGPLIITAGGAFFFRDRITSREKMGIAIVLIGVALNSFYPIFKAEGVRLSGNILLLLFLLVDSASILIAKKAVQKGISPINLTNLAFIIGAIVFLPLVLTTQGAESFLKTLTNLPVKYHLGVWYMALLAGSLAYFLYVRAQRSIEVSEAVLFSYLQPLFTVPLAIFWLGESISKSFIIGSSIIVVGLVIAEHKKKRYNKTAKINQV